MPLFTGATHRIVAGHTDGPMSAHVGVVLHVNESNGNLYNWVNGDHDMSCHFEVYKDGTAEQYLDTANTSWCQMAGNGTYISIETEGYHTEAFTPAQVDRIANLVAQAHLIHGIPLQVADEPGQRGLGWHGMGGNAWGGHPDCPGPKRKSQRKEILAKARALVAAHDNPTPAPTPTPTPPPLPVKHEPAPNKIVSADRLVDLAILNTGLGRLDLPNGDTYLIDFTKIGDKQ